ncbi:MAG: deoxyribonuclease IV [Sciscionella sp.]
MRIGAHVRDDDPLALAEQLNVDVVQFFLSDPQSWTAPRPHPQADAVRYSEVEVFIHSPYVINVASQNNRIRIPSRKAVLAQADAAAELGAKGLVVHGGHLTKGDDPADGIANWRKLFQRQAADGGFGVPVLIENTAGGENAMARKFDMLARLWDMIGEFGPGFVLDTCHAHAAGEDLADAVDRVLAITERIDLLHLNNSRDTFGSARDRHANLAAGTIPADALVAVADAAQAPVVLETPPEGQAEDVALLRAALAR